MAIKLKQTLSKTNLFSQLWAFWWVCMQNVLIFFLLKGNSTRDKETESKREGWAETGSSHRADKATWRESTWCILAKSSTRFVAISPLGERGGQQWSWKTTIIGGAAYQPVINERWRCEGLHPGDRGSRYMGPRVHRYQLRCRVGTSKYTLFLKKIHICVKRQSSKNTPFLSNSHRSHRQENAFSKAWSWVCASLTIRI